MNKKKNGIEAKKIIFIFHFLVFFCEYLDRNSSDIIQPREREREKIQPLYTFPRWWWHDLRHLWHRLVVHNMHTIQSSYISEHWTIYYDCLIGTSKMPHDLFRSFFCHSFFVFVSVLTFSFYFLHISFLFLFSRTIPFIIFPWEHLVLFREFDFVSAFSVLMLSSLLTKWLSSSSLLSSLLSASTFHSVFVNFSAFQS